MGVPPLLATLAVNVTDWPNTDGFNELATVVFVELLTTCVRGAEVLGRNGEGPLYETVIT